MHTNPHVAAGVLGESRSVVVRVGFTGVQGTEAKRNHHAGQEQKRSQPAAVVTPVSSAGHARS
ncbi:MAG TPA: hypothetical protein VJS86_02655 [Arthrobacter sp.]|nr:hypothetical protein [Arthrobacter sp.]